MCQIYTNKILGYHLQPLNFAPKIKIMETTKSRGKFWVWFVLSLVALFVFVTFLPQYFWVVLPFNFTFFAKGMNLL